MNTHKTAGFLARYTKITHRAIVLLARPAQACRQFYQHGWLDLDMPLADPYLLGPEFAQNGKSAITPRNLLLHNSGFPADPFPGYGAADFGCPATNSSLHPPLVFTCSDLILQAVFKQTLKNPVGAVFLYSDLSMITLSFTLGKLVQQLQLVAPSDLLPVCAGQHVAAQQQYLCWYEAYIRLHVFAFNPSSWQVPAFLPADGSSCPSCNIAPAYFDADYRHEQMWGQVSDANAYAMGGVSGHAGVFANGPALANLVSNILFASSDSSWINATTVAYFIKAQNVSQVCLLMPCAAAPTHPPHCLRPELARSGLGHQRLRDGYVSWLRQLQRADIHAHRQALPRGRISTRHLNLAAGYTGTQICADPVSGVISILLTNRCFPDDKGLPVIASVRRAFSNAVLAALAAESL
jgi:serine-type D-Ala-D-Ala carboxypeptidase